MAQSLTRAICTLLPAFISCSGGSDVVHSAGTDEIQRWFVDGPEWVRDVGVTLNGEAIEFDFTLRSAAGEPIRIVESYKNCACQSVNIDDRWLSRGEATVVKTVTVVNASPSGGSFSATVHLIGESRSGIRGYVGTVELRGTVIGERVIAVWPPLIAIAAERRSSGARSAEFDILLPEGSAPPGTAEFRFASSDLRFEDLTLSVPEFVGALSDETERWRCEATWGGAQLPDERSDCSFTIYATVGSAEHKGPGIISFGEAASDRQRFVGAVWENKVLTIALPTALVGIQSTDWAPSPPFTVVSAVGDQLTLLASGMSGMRGVFRSDLRTLQGRASIALTLRGLACERR